jgi:hypothetical protein
MTRSRDLEYYEEVHYGRQRADSPPPYVETHTGARYVGQRAYQHHPIPPYHEELEQDRTYRSDFHGNYRDERAIHYRKRSRSSSSERSRNRSLSRYQNRSPERDELSYQQKATDKKAIAHPLDDDSDYDSIDEEERRKKARRKQLLYTGLAAITTIAATNNIYQSTKAYKTRRKELQEGLASEEEVRKARNKAIAMDVISVGIGAVCINNAVNGWKKTKAMQAEERERRKRFDDHPKRNRPRDGERDEFDSPEGRRRHSWDDEYREEKRHYIHLEDEPVEDRKRHMITY